MSFLLRDSDHHPVFLESAVWFIRDGAFDQSGGEGGREVVFSEIRPVF